MTVQHLTRYTHSALRSNYNAAVQELRDGSSGFIHNRVIAGFAAYASVDG
jgi:hypothetical protein